MARKPARKAGRLTITDEQGVVVETFSLGDYDLSKPIARSVFMGEVLAACERERASRREE